MFVVYKTINIVSGKYYIGVHKTDNPNDGYMGSGRAIVAAIKKDGRASFVKKILFVFDNKEDAFTKEIELTADFHLRSTYNMRRGGVGGFTRETALRGVRAANMVGASKRGGRSAVAKRAGVHGCTREQMAAFGKKGGQLTRKTNGGRLSEEHRLKIGRSLTGKTIPDDVRRKMSASRIGKPLSDQHKLNLKAAMKASWSRRRLHSTAASANGS